jgi:hypothetical protein
MSDERRRLQDLPVEELIDELWPYPQPPPRFAARVLSAHRKRAGRAVASVRPPRRRILPLALSAAAGLALAAGVGLFLHVMGGEGSPSIVRSDGQLRADERQTVRLDERVLVVAEKGSEIGWTARADGLRVDQPRGDVFYRVDKGDAFVVVTPAGEVQVTGTCFRVAVDEPGTGHLAPRMRVEVSEGSVKARSGPHEIVLRAGEEARLSPDQLPLRSDRTGEAGPVAEATYTPSPAEVRAWERSSRLRALEAEARVRQLERALAVQTPAGPRVSGLPPRRKLFGFTPEERAALARRCDFRWGLPRHLTQWANPNFDKRLVIDAAESAAITRVMEEHRTDFIERLRALYLEIVGNEQAVLTLSPMAMRHEITSKSRTADGKEARQGLLLEWAGRRPPPSDLSRQPPLDRFWRLLTGAADDFVRQLTPILGPQRAHELAVDLTDSSVYGHERNCLSGEKPPASPGP